MPNLTVSSPIDTFMQAASQTAMLAALNITLGGAFTTSGAFTTTLTVTANTSVTLPVSGTLAILGTNAFTAAQSITLAQGAATYATGLNLTNVTAAANNSQQYSPSLILTGQGWRTTGSTSATFAAEITAVPIQESFSHYGTVQIRTVVAGTPSSKSLNISHVGSPGNPTLTMNGAIFDGFSAEGNGWLYSTGGSGLIMLSSSLCLGSGVALGFASAANPDGANNDTFFGRKSAAVLRIGLDAAGVTNQMLTAASRITSDGVGANLTLVAGNGRGGAGGDLTLSYWTTGSTGVIGSLTTAMTVNVSGVTMALAVPLRIASGTNQRVGETTLVGGTVTVPNTTVTANTKVFAQRKTAGGTIGMSLTWTVSAGTSFSLTSDNILDTSIYTYVLIENP